MMLVFSRPQLYLLDMNPVKISCAIFQHLILHYDYHYPNPETTIPKADIHIYIGMYTYTNNRLHYITICSCLFLYIPIGPCLENDYPGRSGPFPKFHGFLFLSPPSALISPSHF